MKRRGEKRPDHPGAGSIRKKIRRSEKEVTILFTDIVSSAAFWETAGDVEGRIMMDRHNRLVIPRIRKHGGRVVKIIGDSVMACFRKPAGAVTAATAIQQTLKKERDGNPDFPAVRIGIHVGTAIVEKGDVYGDTVNTASRIMNRAGPGEILLSTRTARRMSAGAYHLEKYRRFTPRGKKQSMTLYKCRWQRAPDRTGALRTVTFRLLPPGQKAGIILSALLTAGALLLLHLKYLRYILADNETLALLTLNPAGLIMDMPWLGAVLLLVCGAVLAALVRLKKTPVTVYRLLRGGAGFLLVYGGLSMLLPAVRDMIPPELRDPVYSSRHLFVEIVSQEAPVRASPSESGKVLRTMRRGTLLLQSDVHRGGGLVWNKILVGLGKYGWVLRAKPPEFGVPEKRISLARPFVFTKLDICLLVAGLAGWLAAVFTFRLRPA